MKLTERFAENVLKGIGRYFPISQDVNVAIEKNKQISISIDTVTLSFDNHGNLTGVLSAGVMG